MKKFQDRKKAVARVWFLTGVISPSTSPLPNGSAIRSCIIPVGKTLFFPILNTEWDDSRCMVPPTMKPFSVQELRVLAKQGIDTVRNMAAEVDGVPIQGLANVGDTPYTGPYRVTSPVFGVNFPAQNNVAQYFGCNATGEQAPFVSDGVFLMLAPLSAGLHTIHFSGSIPSYMFNLDITYHLTVQ